ncbi:hypothetical protein FHX76_002235 [Lysinibacter cavernae]|uniref:Uncharacterized protein n=1 Tax=Lysinibacter cavernae TaxID=1640652 RepID=A0A7X5TU96_9MICO|nr:hypothetical protein [Lysinibacter cavernae]
MRQTGDSRVTKAATNAKQRLNDVAHATENFW